jgi:hypothetical protein
MSLNFINEAINAKKYINGGFLTKTPDKIMDIIKLYDDNKLLVDNTISVYDAATLALISSHVSMKDVNKK